MLSGVVSDREAVLATLAEYRAVCQKLTTLGFTGFDTAELLDLQSEREHCARISAVTDHRILAAVQGRATAKEIGGKSWIDVLTSRLRISRAAAATRITDAEDLGPPHAM